MRHSLSILLVCAGLGACMPADGEVLRSPLDAPDVQAASLDPLDQSNRRDDLSLLVQLRRTLVEDAELGAAARNVVVLTDRGEVLLRGTVADEAERARVERRMLAVDGVHSVVNRLETME